MEPWELELEFYTWDSYEKALAKAQGKDMHSEEYYESDDDSFKNDLKQLTGDGGFNDSEWEEING